MHRGLAPKDLCLYFFQKIIIIQEEEYTNWLHNVHVQSGDYTIWDVKENFGFVITIYQNKLHFFLLLKLCFRQYCFDRQGRLIFHLCTKTCSLCVCMCMQHTQHAADKGSSRPACRDFPPHQAPPIKLNHSLKLKGNFAKLQKICAILRQLAINAFDCTCKDDYQK